MLYSLSWIFDHIDEKNINKNSIADIKKILTDHVAEIEEIKKIEIDLNFFSFVIIKSINEKFIEAYSEEFGNIKLNNKIEIEINNNFCFLVKKIDDNKFKFASTEDFGGETEKLFPKFKIENNLINGSWRKKFKDNKYSDYIIKIDNKSIGHRPDLWCQRGLAREICVFLNLNLKNENEIYGNFIFEENNSNNFIKNTNDVSFCAICDLSNINEKNNDLLYSFRLASLNLKPISFIVDLSNYVTADIGHPMHIFDKEKINNFVEFRNASKNESLILLDNEKIELNEEEIIVSNKNEILSLAGIKGGLNSGVNEKTNSIIIEAALFDRKKIKKTALKFNRRTNSSILFEKNLSKYNVILCIKRFLKLLSNDYNLSNPIIKYIGKIDSDFILIINHNEIESLIGIKIEKEKIIEISKKLEFKIELNNESYKINVPWFRTDIRIKEDFIEEIARSIGYNKIEKKPINLPLKGFLKNNIEDKIKEFNYLNNVNESITYSILNEEISNKINYKIPDNNVPLKNGYSEIQKILVPSLVPHLIDQISTYISNGFKEFKLFEISSIWNFDSNKKVNEESVYTLVWYEDSKNKFDFYKKKEFIKNLFKYIGLENKLIWKNKKNENNLYSNISSDLYLNEKIIGSLGFIEPKIIFNNLKYKGSIFIAEIKIKDILENSNMYKIEKNNNYIDISFLINKNISINNYLNELNIKLKENINYIKIYDWFEKEEWIDKRSITLRLILKENLKESNEEVKEKCQKILKIMECEIR